MSKHEPFAVTLRPPSGLSTPELGPLVRAQTVPGSWDAPAAWVQAAWTALWASGLLGGLAAPLAAVPWLITRSRPRMQRKRMWTVDGWDGTGPAPEGPVRVNGWVRGIGEPFLPPGEHEPVVYAHTRFWQATGTGRPAGPAREDVRGMFLDIELAVEGVVRVAPEAVFMIGRGAVVPEVGHDIRWQLGAPWSGPVKGWLRRSCLRNGDRVEAVGHVVREVSVEGERSPGRGVPMKQSLVPAWPGGVWIRRLREE
jgi:hypothetical protein